MLYIVAGGPVELIPSLTDIMQGNQEALWIGVDHGTVTLLEAGIVPAVAIGDFDSVTETEWRQIEKMVPKIIRHPSVKDASDLELALSYACNELTSEIVVLGATGGRLDHQFANIMLLCQFIEKRVIWFVDRQNELTVLSPGKASFSKNEKKYISFIPLSRTLEKVQLSGFKYNGSHLSLPREQSVGISNEISEVVGHISFSNGICLVVRSDDSCSKGMF